ncbi:uncharacterized protein LOC115884507 isoform X2 [Sitophilus oryzae]|uniref:Uncharacterized protein LOC115880181 n=1 Tax=Sitophilus oryzae TaxID=7048 RepID=A0A6J2Y6X1_SITOR|nr:uncharacterized protein LOC115880181 [Sitophilus oryzae]XP_030753187.1 uncharacterized protein LOC115880181 [Sitophilus oryzae]XP_030753192.1 uncharacterized protein LOC115880181 [Sitophilus oryzae]XP_030754057.1 uncharacterized protein LOC115880874 [Sitophilus oryzae]XP_030754058.1 uncharacterized protein LOC115880874 [Sitophilus oryzae]XP_030757722.1 uncharacterized protein LOC115883495 [Sitophilus oryzae]XP_030757724.1 uncharacterized protein LOC115883495 [Sitophilus oryzae]XP_03075896
MQPWVVIAFDEEDSVAVVPNTWLFQAENSKDMCKWPPNSRNATGYVKRRDKPGPDWQHYPITILGDYASYDIALRKAQKAEETSELSSNNDTIKRKRTKNLKYVPCTSSSESEKEEADSETEYPKTPKIRHTEMSKRREARESENILSQMGSKCRSLQVATPKNSPTTSFLSPSPQPQCQFPKPLERDNAPSEKEFRKQVLTKLSIIMAKLGRQDEQLDNIEALLAIRPNDMDLYSNTGIEKIPVSNEDELALLEQFITEPLNFKALAKELSRLGGNMVPEITRKIMYRIMTNEFAQLYSWEGGKGKRKFVNLTLSKVVIDAVRCNKRTANACEDEVILEIKRWLVKAKERISNKNKRRERLAENQEEQLGR